MQRKILKIAATAILGMTALPAGAAMQAATASAPVQVATASVRPDVVQFYQARKNPPVWFRAGQADAGPMLINILRRSSIEGFARGPQLAGEVEAALARAQTGDAAAVQQAERLMSSATAGLPSLVSRWTLAIPALADRLPNRTMTGMVTP